MPWFLYLKYEIIFASIFPLNYLLCGWYSVCGVYRTWRVWTLRGRNRWRGAGWSEGKKFFIRTIAQWWKQTRCMRLGGLSTRKVLSTMGQTHHIWIRSPFLLPSFSFCPSSLSLPSFFLSLGQCKWCFVTFIRFSQLEKASRDSGQREHEWLRRPEYISLWSSGSARWYHLTSLQPVRKRDLTTCCLPTDNFWKYIHQR